MEGFTGPASEVSSSEPYETGVKRGFEDVVELVEPGFPAGEGCRPVIFGENHSVRVASEVEFKGQCLHLLYNYRNCIGDR